MSAVADDDLRSDDREDGQDGALADARRAAEEAALIRLARRDMRAFETIYRRYHVPVYRYCHRRLGEPEAAADATSQTFAQAMGGVDGFHGGSVAAWLFTIARNVVIDLVRYRRPQVDIATIGTLRDGEPTPDLLAIGADQRRSLFVALDRLTTDQRTIVELRLVGFTGAEIAAALGVSPGALRVRQFRAYARLRTLLAAEDFFGDGSGGEGRRS